MLTFSFRTLSQKLLLLLLLCCISNYSYGQCSIYGLNVQTSVSGNTITADIVLNGNLNNAIASALFFDLTYTGNSSVPTIATTCNQALLNVNANNSVATIQTAFNPSPLGTVFGTCNGNTIATLTFNAQPGECINFSLQPFNSDFYIDNNTGAMCTAFIGQNQTECVANTCETYGLSVQTQLNGNVLTADLILNQNFTPQAIASSFDFGMTYSGNSATPTGTSCLGIINVNNSNASVSFANTQNGLDLNNLFNNVCTTNVIATLTFTLQAGECVDFFVDNSSNYVDFATASVCPPLFGIGPITECASLCEPYDLNVQAQVSGTTALVEMVMLQNFTVDEPVVNGAIFMNFSDPVTINNHNSCFGSSVVNGLGNLVLAPFTTDPFHEVLATCPNDVILTATVTGNPGECITVSPGTNSHFVYQFATDDCDVTNTNSVTFCFEDCSPYDLELTADVNGCEATVELIMDHDFLDPTDVFAYLFEVHHFNANSASATSCLTTPNSSSSSSSIFEFNTNLGAGLQACPGGTILEIALTGEPGKCIDVSINTSSRYLPLHDNTILCNPNSIGPDIEICFESSMISGSVSRGAIVCETEPMQNVEITIEDEDGNVVCVTETDADGNYSCEVCPGNYNVLVSEVCDEPCDQVTLEDANILRQIILGILPGFPTYNSVFASDVNSTGGASTIDINLITQAALNNDPIIPNWCNFIPTEQVNDIIINTGTNSAGIPPNDLPDYTNNQPVSTGGGQNTTVDFTMYALGDMNGNCCDEEFGEEIIDDNDPDIVIIGPVKPGPGKPTTGSGLDPKPTTIATPISKPNDIVVIWPSQPVIPTIANETTGIITKPRNLDNSQAISFPIDMLLSNITFSFDLPTEDTKLEDITIGAIKDFEWMFNIVNGKLLVAGLELSMTEIAIAANTTILEVSCDKGKLSLTEDSEWNAYVSHTKGVVPLKPVKKLAENDFFIETYLQKGNNIQLTINSISDTQANIEMLDIFGNVIYQSNESLYLGENDLTIQANFGNGIHIVRLYNEANSASKNLYLFKR